MKPHFEQLQFQTRRQFLAKAGQFSLGAIARKASCEAAPAASASDIVTDPMNPLAVRQPHHAARAKRVIYLHMSGGPPHLDTFD